MTKPALPSDELFDPGRTTSGKAIASLTLGVLFFFACLSGIPAILLGNQALSDIRSSKGRLRGSGLAMTGMILGVIGCLFTIALFLPATRSAREAARRSQCVCDLKQIGLAMHNYHSTWNCFPPRAITDKDGKPLLSWRVAILPFVEQNALYAEFHLDEPWDSPHNLPLLNKMPLSYACPSDNTLKPGMTGYQAIIGPNTAFSLDFKPLQIEDFTDGTSNTLFIGESRRSVPWTKPDDLPFDMTVPLTGLGSQHSGGFNTLFADGSVKFLKSTIKPTALRAIITRSGNESISAADY